MSSRFNAIQVINFYRKWNTTANIPCTMYILIPVQLLSAVRIQDFLMNSTSVSELADNKNEIWCTFALLFHLDWVKLKTRELAFFQARKFKTKSQKIRTPQKINTMVLSLIQCFIKTLNWSSWQKEMRKLND